jgi:hypothetical protein
MRQLRRLGLLMASVLVATGCASMNISAYVRQGTELSKYRTYAWRAADTLSTGDPRLDNNWFFDERVRKDVDTQLAVKGFVKVGDGTPDVLVRYHANITQQIQGQDVNPSARCADDECRSDVFEAGTLLIDLVDARTNELLWRGWSEGTIDGVIDDQKWLEETVDNAVRRIFRQLPPRL